MNADDAAFQFAERTRTACEKHATDAPAMLGECRRLVTSTARFSQRTRDALARVIADHGGAS